MQGGAARLAEQNESSWALPLGCLVLGLRNVGLGGALLGECLAAEHDLQQWQEEGNLKLRDQALRGGGGWCEGGRGVRVHQCSVKCNGYTNLECLMQLI